MPKRKPNAKPKQTNKKSIKKQRLTKGKKAVTLSSQKGRTKKPVTKNKKVLPKDPGRKGVTKSKRIVSSESGTKRRGVKAAIIRGKNTIKISGTGQPENLAKRIDKTNLNKQLDYLVKKNKPVKGKGYKEPKAIVVITKVKTDDGTTKTFSEISEPDFVVNKDSAKKFLTSKTNAVGSIFDEIYGIDSENLKVLEVQLKFIY